MTAKKTNERETSWTSNWKALMEEYGTFGKVHRALTDETMKTYTYYLGRFFTWLMGESGLDGLGELDFKSLDAFILAYGETAKQGTRMAMHSALRSFLHFAYTKGHVSMDLRKGIPTVRKWALSKVPFILSDESVSQMLGAIDRETDVGLRDYAAIQILYRYGVRGIQIRKMMLQDIHWSANRIMIPPAKRGEAVEQPLILEVGNALVDYLQKGRSQTTGHQEVFLTTQSPWKPLAQATMSAMVARRLKRAKVQIPENASKGSHLFRHLFASKMLRNGVPLDYIAEMLGHRNENSTLIYTKIDFNNLMEVASEWPEVHP